MASTISETKLLAAYLLPLVQEKLSTGVDLQIAAATAAREAHDHMRTTYNLCSLKDICSGKTGGLGKLKKARRTQQRAPKNEEVAASDTDSENPDSVRQSPKTTST